MALTRRRSEERRRAVLEFFLKNPSATGDEAQAELTAGRLTGEKGPQLSTAILYELRKQAAGMMPAGTRAARPRPADDDLADLRKAAQDLQRLLLAAPGVSEVVVTRDGSRVVRQREEPL